MTESYPGESNDTGEQTVMQFKARPTYLEASADIQYLRTDNMFLSEHDTQKADELISTVQVALAPTPYAVAGGSFAPRVGFREQWYDFGLGGAKLDGTDSKLSSYDFNGQTAFLDLSWSRAQWTFAVGFDFIRLLSTQNYNEFYRESVPHWSLQRVFPLPHNASIALGYEGDYRVSDLRSDVLTVNSDYNDRTDHGGFLNYTQPLGKHAVLQPFYHFKYTHFTTSSADRDDYLNSLGVALYWFFTPQISARVFVDYDLRHSSQTIVSDYSRLDTGLGMNLTFRF